MAAKIRPRKIYMPGDMGDRKARREYRKNGPVVIVREGRRKIDDRSVEISSGSVPSVR